MSSRDRVPVRVRQNDLPNRVHPRLGPLRGVNAVVDDRGAEEGEQTIHTQQENIHKRIEEKPIILGDKTLAPIPQ